MGFPLDSFGVSMGFLSESYGPYGISMIFLLDFYTISMRFQQDFCGTTIGFAQGVFMVFLWDLCDSPGKFIWDSYRKSMIFLVDFLMTFL